MNFKKRNNICTQKETDLEEEYSEHCGWKQVLTVMF